MKPAAGRLLHGALIACALGLVMAAYLWLMTDGTGQLRGYEFLGDGFDSLAASLVRGECSVDPDFLAHEGMRVGDATYMYFGPWPALLRVAASALWPDYARFWSRLSCLVAALLCLVAFAWLVRRSLTRGRGDASPGRGALTAGLVIAFGLASPMLQLMTSGRIYHEAILWGLAGALGALCGAVGIARGWLRPARGLLLISGCAAVALLARLTYGGVACLLLAFTAGRLLRLPDGRALVLAACLPCLAAVGFQAWYNQCRFGSPLQTIDYENFYYDPGDFGGELNPRRIPHAVSAYFGVSPDHFTARFPHVQERHPSTHPEHLYRGFSMTIFPLTLGSAWLLAGAAAGLLPLLRLNLGWSSVGLLLLLSLQWGLIFCFHHRVQRYSAELLPLLVFLLSVALSSAAAAGGSATWKRVAMAGLVAASLLLNTGATINRLAVEDQSVGEPFSARVNGWLGRPPQPTIRWPADTPKENR